VSARPAPSALGVSTRLRPLLVALALGRVEAGKLLRHPASVVGAILTCAAAILGTWKDVPVLNRYDGFTSESLIPFGCGILLAAHLGSMRARRHRTTELFDSLASSATTATTGHLFAVGYAVVFAFVISIAQLTYMKAVGGVTAPRPAVVLLGPALVAFGGSFGVALGRWAPRLFAAPIGLACIVALCTAVTTNTYAHDREWLSLWVPSEFLDGVATETSLRPHGWRLLYVAALALLAAAIAFAYHRRRRLLVIGFALLALLGCAYAGRMQMRPVSRGEQIAFADAFIDDLRDRSCRELASVRYCPMDGYGGWVERWRAPVQGVLAATPTSARPESLELVQIPHEADVWDDDRNRVVANRLRRARRMGLLGPADAIHPSLRWGRNGADGKHEMALALEVAERATGIDTRFHLTATDVEAIRRPRRRGYRIGAVRRNCITLEQGRSIVALWLAARATPEAEIAFRSAAGQMPYVAERSGDPSRFFSAEQWALDGYIYDVVGDSDVTWGTRESAYAEQLLERNDADVQAAIAANWDRLTDPGTTSDEAASLLGLTPLPPLADAVEEWKAFRHYRGIHQFGIQCH
jgi:hypothetical protein